MLASLPLTLAKTKLEKGAAQLVSHSQHMHDADTSGFATAASFRSVVESFSTLCAVSFLPQPRTLSESETPHALIPTSLE